MSDQDFKSVGAMDFISTRNVERPSKTLRVAFQVEVSDAVASHLLSKDFDWDEFFTQLKASPEWFMTGIELWQKRYEETIDNQETALVTLSAKNDTLTAERDTAKEIIKELVSAAQGLAASRTYNPEILRDLLARAKELLK